MSFKLKGSISPPKFKLKKIGDKERMVGCFEFEFLRSENRHLDANGLIDLAEEVNCSVEIKPLDKEQRDLFKRTAAEVRLIDFEQDKAARKNKKVQELIKKLKEDDSKEKLTAAAFSARVDEIDKLLYPPLTPSDKSDQRRRLEELAFSEEVNKISEAQKAMHKIEAEDKKKRLTEKQLKARLDKIDQIILKHSEGQSQASMGLPS
ncbi:MAG TPA: hypothetical protein ENO22_05830 [candidate division Zixibacteria bacterium]|nr:hypothetical protein [candidate division Zixibacteria bacterium]